MIVGERRQKLDESSAYYSSDDDEDDTESCFDSDEEDCLVDILNGRGSHPSRRLGDILEEYE